MFQRLSNLLFGEVEEVSAELNGPKPCVTEADEEGWLLVSVPEGAPAEASPMEDLLIEHPSMSVYVSLSNLDQSTANVADTASETFLIVNRRSSCNKAGIFLLACSNAYRPVYEFSVNTGKQQ
ncbi:tumor protein p53-inducible nuclear protein 2 isoform X3 [Clarias magur]|uniref:Tumor protein p53-inducible nuclear protein 2 isoform X3 n=1 Tax=Clarias magur TaxID=1594786 RepID=A0A8J4UM25_CLAMG|nr:tumor protein p53-inducible nuclear protein 2 isoform X3 [Clarias magur]